MTLAEARYILGLLGPLDSPRQCYIVRNGQLAIAILEEPAKVTRQQLALACKIHDHLAPCLLIVL